MEGNDAVDAADAAAQYELFNRVRTHLLRQGRKAISDDEGTRCRYRAVVEDVIILSCAVGCLIADAAYHPEMEGLSVDQITTVDGRWEPSFLVRNSQSARAIATALNLSGVPAHGGVRRLLQTLQLLHDRYDPHSWEQRLLELERSLPLIPEYDP